MYPASIQIAEKERMYPASVDEQPKHAYGLHGYPQPAVTVGLPANNAHNDTNNYPQIPPPPPPQQQMEETNRWTTGLCNCCDDCCSCWLTYFCPCIAFGQIAEIIDKGSTSCGISGCIYAMILHFLGCPCLYSFSYRTKLRAKFNLKEDPCGDCLVHCFCESCALCQEYRELKNRGFDPALGWVGYLEKQERTAAEQARTPPAGQAMNR